MTAPVTLDLTLDQVPIRSMNAHDHWRKRQEHSKHVRTTVAWIANGVRPRPCFDNGPVRISVTLLAPDRRRRDPDGIAAAAKPMIDAIVDAGWIEDDSWAHVESVTYSTFPAETVAQEPGWVLHIAYSDDMDGAA